MIDTKRQYELMLESTQDLINLCPFEIKENLNDGYHSFKELYDFRKIYKTERKTHWSFRQWDVSDTLTLT